jgi:hypothetical protein
LVAESVDLGCDAAPRSLSDREIRLKSQSFVDVSFTEVCAATRRASEDAHLVFADQCLAAVLLPAEGGWYLQAGFGPCDHEVIVFDTLSSAADWVRECFAAAASAF